MRHRKSGRQLGRKTHHRRDMFRSLVTSLLQHERIETTEAKAKELRILADRAITLGKQGDLGARRRALAYVRSKTVVGKLFSDLATRFSERRGGYTRLIKTRQRIGDAAPMVVIELLARTAERKNTPPSTKTTPPGQESKPKG
jgi:large subunit ribosomal protein L17